MNSRTRPVRVDERMTTAIALAVVTAGLSACTTTFPRDLSAVSISRVSRADVTRIVGEVPFFSNEDEFLVVRVSTHRDIIAHAAKRHSTLVANGSLCEDGRELLTAPDVYVQGREPYDPLARDAWLAKPMKPTAAGSYEYDTIHVLQWSGAEGRPGYDLRHTPQDICLQIGGWYFFVFESNVVRISSEEIEAAIVDHRGLRGD
jgi:hypothetical protein